MRMLIVGLALLTTVHQSPLAAAEKPGMRLTSPAFQPNDQIPAEYTCDGSDTIPPLNWSNVPANARSLALVIADPDAPDPKAPKMTWVHWIAFDIPPSASGISRGGKNLAPSVRFGTNDWKRTAYGGPCPPIGRHRYVHTLYALDVMLADLRAPTRAKLEQAIQGHVLAQAELIGTYQKK